MVKKFISIFLIFAMLLPTSISIVYADSYTISVSDVLYVMPQIGNQKFVCDLQNDGTTVSDEYTISSSNTGIRWDNGYLKTDGSITGDTSLTLTAYLSEVPVATKDVSVKVKPFYDFESAQGSYSLSNVTSDGSNSFLYVPSGTRVSTSTLMDTVDDNTIANFEFKFMKPTENVVMYFNPAKAYNSSNVLINEWWTKIDISSGGVVKYNAQQLSGFSDGSWNHFKVQLDFKNERAVVWLNNTQNVITDFHRTDTGCTGYHDYMVQTFIIDKAYDNPPADEKKIKIDDVCFYGGDVMSQSIESINAPQKVIIPSVGQKTVPLRATVTEDGMPTDLAPVKWEIIDDTPDDGILISGNKLVVSPDASGSKTIKATIKGAYGDGISGVHTIEFIEPNIDISSDSSGNIVFARAEGETFTNIDVKIFGPKNVTAGDEVSKFVDAYTLEDGQLPVADESILLTDGKNIYNTNALKGKYNIYASEHGEDTWIPATVLIGADTLLQEPQADILEVLGSESLVNVLPEFTSDLTDDTFKSSEYSLIYQALSDKSKVADLIDGSFNNYYAAIMYAKLLEDSSYNDDTVSKLKTEITKAGLVNIDTELSLLQANENYTEVVNSAGEFSDFDDLNSKLKTAAILCGVKNAAEKRDAKIFLAELDCEKYDNANSIEKNAIADIVAQMSYQTLDELIGVINGIDLTSIAINAEIKGINIIYLAPGAGNQKIGYSVYDGDTEIADAVIKFDRAYDGLRMENNTLKTCGKTLDSAIKLIAELDGEVIAQKTVALEELIFGEFETGANGYRVRTSSDNTNREPSDGELVKTETGGNKYIDIDGFTRVTSPGMISGVIQDNSLTLSIDIKNPGAKSKIEFSRATLSKPNTAVNDSWWWLLIEIEANGTVKCNGSEIGSISGTDWNHLDITFDFARKEATAVLGPDTPIDVPFDSAKTANDEVGSAYKIENIILSGDMDVDNIALYSGEMMEQSLDIDVPSTAYIPPIGFEKSIELKSTVHEDSIENPDTPVKWYIDGECSFARINGNILTYNSDATGNIAVKANILGTKVTQEQTISFENPCVDFSINSSGDIVFKRREGESFNNIDVKIYGPKNVSDNVSKFTNSYSINDGEAPVADSTYTLNADGEYAYSTAELIGKYTIYVSESGENAWYDMQIILNSDKLLDGNSSLIINNLNSVYLEDVLFEFTSDTTDNKEKASVFISLYNGLSDKETVIKLMAKNEKKSFDYFYAACLYAKLLENQVYDESLASNLTDEIYKLSLDDISDMLTLLKKNVYYTEVTDSVYGYTDINSLTSMLTEQAILKGVKNVANKQDAGVFLNKLGNSKYNNADADGKSKICDAVGKNTYTSIPELNTAVNGVDISDGGGGYISDKSPSAGGISASVSGSFPSNDTSSQIGFSDVPAAHWSYTAVSHLYKNGIISGYNGMYKPDDDISRAEFVKILVETFKIKSVSNISFNDVNSQMWFYPYICAAASNKLVIGDGTDFYPDNSITRQEAAVMAYRFSIFSGLSISQNSDSKFADNADISDWAKTGVASMENAGLISGVGNGNFAPLRTITRAEAAQIIYNILMQGGNR